MLAALHVRELTPTALPSIAVFSNIVSQDHLRQLAEADERSVVKQVQVMVLCECCV